MMPVAPSPLPFMQRQTAWTALITVAQSVASVPPLYLEETLTFLFARVSKGSGSDLA